MAWGQYLLLGHQVTMSGETVWQGLAAILLIFHWTVLCVGPEKVVRKPWPWDKDGEPRIGADWTP